MIVAYCVFPGDQDLALKNVEWWNQLGGCKGHDCLFIFDKRCSEEVISSIFLELTRCFDKVNQLKAGAEIDGWPEGANYFFRLVASTLQNVPGYPYFLWMEPDAIPTRPGWLDALEAEYKRGNKPFMGDRVEVENIPLHMSGVGFYPMPLHKFAGEAYRAHEFAWDMSGKDQIVPQAYFTNLIEHAWKHPTFTDPGELGTQVSPEAVVFHSSKDGSLINLLREKLFPAVPVLAEPKGNHEQRASSNAQSAAIGNIRGEARESTNTTGTERSLTDSRGDREIISVQRSPQGNVSPFPAQPEFTCDIFIRTYQGDYQWLEYCLQAIDKFCSGFRKVWIASPDNPPVWMLEKTKHPGPIPLEWLVMNEESEDHYLSQQIHKLYADAITNYQADFILNVDSDVIFTRPTTPQDFLSNGNPYWLYTPYPNTETPWQPITEKFMNMQVDNEFMRRFPIMIPRWLYGKLREFCHQTHKRIISEYVRNQPERSFSEFNALGAFAWQFHRGAFAWLNTQEDALPPLYARQFHSWGGITLEVKKEIDQILSGPKTSQGFSGAEAAFQEILPAREEPHPGCDTESSPAQNPFSSVEKPPASPTSLVTERAAPEPCSDGGGETSIDDLISGVAKKMGAKEISFENYAEMAFSREKPPNDFIKALPNGIWVIADDTHISKWVEKQGRLDHDMNSLPFILPLIKEGDTVVDGGAFIGDHTIAYAKKVGPSGAVIAFEPNPFAYQCLQHNMKDQHKVAVYERALAGFSGKQRLSWDGNYGAAHIAEKGFAVATERLDDYHIVPDLIKLDVEGFELSALMGAENTINKHQPTLVIEINTVALERQGILPQNIFDWLRGHFYRWEIIQEGCTEQSPMFDIIATPRISPSEKAPLTPTGEMMEHVKALAEYSNSDRFAKMRVLRQLQLHNIIKKQKKK